ncbi:putative kinase-interacting protein [Echinococcus granulosus]|uniref:Kinase-interacting protein n=1 Tax=Echinococcus granulosus TaxID=6210 RepID=W6UC43_ECHGR|nr:putative kinase-interacting protein [Echinococcus granulosus]EUB58745.1 putative kinase-interacting protein [Echinococcus granulosus]
MGMPLYTHLTTVKGQLSGFSKTAKAILMGTSFAYYASNIIMSTERAEEVVEAPQGDKIDNERGSYSDLRLLASAETADLTDLSTEVQAIAHRFNAEFEAVLAAGEADSGAGAAIVQRLLPTVVAVLEQLDEFYKDHAAYKAEVIQLREETTSLFSQLTKEKAARRDTEDLLMRVEDQFESERKILNEALAQNETQIRRLEIKSKNVGEQLARMEQKEQEIFEGELQTPRANQRAVTIACRVERFPETVSCNASLLSDEATGLSWNAGRGEQSDSGEHGANGDQVGFLTTLPYTLSTSRNALNVVKDDLLLQRDSLKADNQLLMEAVKQLTEKQTMLQQELVNSDQMLTTARTEIESLKATVEKLKRELSTKGFTKAEMMRIITDRNYYKERFIELRDAIKLMEMIRAGQRGHPDLLDDLPPTVTDVQVHQNASPHHQLKSVFARIDDLERRHEDGPDAKPVATTSGGGAASRTFQSQQWIKIYQSPTTGLTFGWIRGFGRVRQGKAELSTTKNPTSLFSPVAHPVPKKCRSIGRSTLRIELTAALSVAAPLEGKCAQHLWLIGRGAASEAVSGKKKLKNVGKLYIFDPLQLTDALVSMDLDDDFLPISAGLFSVAEPLNDYRVLIAASDGRFLVCATTSNPDAISKEDAWRVTLLSTFKMANPGEAATTIVLALPSQTPCLHAIAVGDEEATSSAETSASTSRRLIWLAVSGQSPPTPTIQQRGSVEGAEGVYLGPLSRLLSVCAEKHIFLHKIDLTSVLTSMIGNEGALCFFKPQRNPAAIPKVDNDHSIYVLVVDTTGVLDPVDLTVSRLLVQGNECIWFATRCGLIGRFFIAFLLNDAADGSPTEVLSQDAISLSCHGYRRPISALLAIRSTDPSNPFIEAFLLFQLNPHPIVSCRSGGGKGEGRHHVNKSGVVPGGCQPPLEPDTNPSKLIPTLYLKTTLAFGDKVFSLKAEELVGNIGGVSESKASVDDAARSPEKVDQVEQAIKMPTQEKVEPPIQTEVAAPQSEITKSPIAQDHTRGNSPPIVEVSVQLHEEEEDYGDEEEEEKVENTRKEEGVEKLVIAVNATPKTSPPEGSDGENSAFRKPAPPPPPSNPSVPAPVRKETRAVGFTVEAPERVNSAVEAKCPPSSLVYIRCLVRPFTAAQLSTMLETHFGRASELWLDRIKSTAVARFSNEEVATRCREGLDGCRWPSINPRILQCEFASEALLAWLKEHGEAGDKPPPRHLLGGSSAASAASTNETNDSSVERKRPEKSMDDTETMGGAKRRRLHGIEGVTKATEKEVEGRGKRDTRGEESSKSLDDLFKKTEATPSVYWLPLTDEAKWLLPFLSVQTDPIAREQACDPRKTSFSLA